MTEPTDPSVGSSDIAVADDPPNDLTASASRRHWRTWRVGTAIGDRGGRALPDDRKARLRLLALSGVGVGCLFATHFLAPQQGSLFTGPSGAGWWLAAICGVAGAWLVPSLWLSAVMMRVGAGPTAWLGTRIATTLGWYALMGPVIHHFGQKARVTTLGILGVTIAATVAICVGVAIGLVPRLANLRSRVIVAVVVGAVCAQAALLVARLTSTDDSQPYSHSIALDCSIVIACALLVTIGAVSSPKLPPVMTLRDVRTPLVAMSVIGITAIALLVVGAKWSPAQQMPSAYSAEQIPSPPGVDVAFALTAIGPNGSDLIRRADFVASNDTGVPVSIVTRVEPVDATADQVTLLMQLQRSDQPTLCGDGRLDRAIQAGAALKFTVRDKSSGLLTQATVPVGWCEG